MIGYFAEVEPSGRYVQCISQELPSVELPSPGDPNNALHPVAAPPASWNGATPTEVLYLVDGVEVWEETATLEQARTNAWEATKASRAAAELSPFEFDGGMYDADTPRISGAALNALMAQLAGVPFSIDWTLADNTVRTLDGAQMQALGVALAQHVGTAFAIARAKRDAIAAAQSPAAAYEAAAWPQS